MAIPPWLGTSRSTTDERGVVAIEFALVVPILLTLLLGTVTTALSYSNVIGVTNAVRETARFAATSGAADMSTWGTSAVTRFQQTQFSGVHNSSGVPTTSICVQLWRVTGAGSGTVLTESCLTGADGPALTAGPTTASAEPAVPTSMLVGQCVVRVVAARDFNVNTVVAGNYTSTAYRYAVARFERSDITSWSLPAVCS